MVYSEELKDWQVEEASVVIWTKEFAIYRSKEEEKERKDLDFRHKRIYLWSVTQFHPDKYRWSS